MLFDTLLEDYAPMNKEAEEQGQDQSEGTEHEDQEGKDQAEHPEDEDQAKETSQVCGEFLKSFCDGIRAAIKSLVICQ